MISRPPWRSSAVVLAEARRAKGVDGDVDPLATGDPANLLGEVLGAVVDRMVDSLLADRVVLRGRGGTEDLGAEAPGDLRCGDPDPAGRSVDQDPLALLQPCHHDQPA